MAPPWCPPLGRPRGFCGRAMAARHTPRCGRDPRARRRIHAGCRAGHGARENPGGLAGLAPPVLCSKDSAPGRIPACTPPIHPQTALLPMETTDWVLLSLSSMVYQPDIIRLITQELLDAPGHVDRLLVINGRATPGAAATRVGTHRRQRRGLGTAFVLHSLLPQVVWTRSNARAPPGSCGSRHTLEPRSVS